MESKRCGEAETGGCCGGKRRWERGKIGDRKNFAWRGPLVKHARQVEVQFRSRLRAAAFESCAAVGRCTRERERERQRDMMDTRSRKVVSMICYLEPVFPRIETPPQGSRATIPFSIYKTVHINLEEAAAGSIAIIY